MRYKPHDYQAQAADFITSHRESAVFLGMGLGKTVITLTAIDELMLDRFEIARTLVIAPLRVAATTWPTEARQWDHLRHLSVSVVVGTAAERRAALDTPAHVYVINRENVPWLVGHYGASWPFDMVVIDELSSFKSHSAKRTRALVKIRPLVRRFVGLTGTPASNGLMDLFAQFLVLDGGERLGRFITRYRDRYFTPDKRSAYQVYSWRLRDGAEDQIYEAISDMTMSMKTVDHLELPGLTVVDVPVTMSASERSLYRRLERDMVADIDDNTVIDAASAGVLAGKLAQLAAGAIYTDSPSGMEYLVVHDRKLDVLEDLIESANGQSVLVACWYRHDIDRIRRRVPAAQPITTPEAIDAWNRGEIEVGLIHPASAGHGLNLQKGGHILVWFSLTWSLELYQQTNARLYRQGQTEPVTIHRIVTRDTIDQRVTAALETKDATQEQLLAAVRDIAARSKETR